MTGIPFDPEYYFGQQLDLTRFRGHHSYYCGHRYDFTMSDMREDKENVEGKFKQSKCIYFSGGLYVQPWSPW